MIKSEHSVFINRPVDDVWNFMSNLENVNQWDPEFLDIRIVSSGEVGVGSIVEYRRQFLGHRPTGFFRVSEYMPNRELSIQVTEKRISGHIRYLFDSVEGGTRVTGISEGEVSGWLKLMTMFLIPMLERDSLKDLENVKRILEALS